MTFEREPSSSPFTYDDWKLQLRKNCELQGKILAFNGLGDYALRLLWEDGIDPSVEAIVGYPKTLKEEMP